MAVTTDLYSILKAYSNKNNSPYIKIEPFLSFLGKYAARMAKRQSDWAQWTEGTASRFWNELTECTGDGRCVLMTDTDERRVYLPFFYAEKVQDAYRSFDDRADIPFPTETSLNITIPEEQLTTLHLETDLVSYFDKPAESLLPIIKMQFPDEDMGSILVLAPMLRRRFLEASVLKVQSYLLAEGHGEHTVHRLAPQLSGNKEYVREIINQITGNPMECVNNMEAYRDGAYLFWSYFCAMIKDEVKKQREKLAQDIAVLEAVYVIDICNTFFKYRAQQNLEREAAFHSLDQRMEMPPYYYSLAAITKFANKQGGLLLGKYSPKELETYIRKKTTESINNGAPEWLIIQGGEDERWFIQKNKYLPMVGSMLVNTRPEIKRGIIDRWINLIREFKREEAMKSDTEFDKILTAVVDSTVPMLACFLKDDKLFMVYEELERAEGEIPPSLRIFDDGKMLPMSSLFQMNRQDLFLDAKFSLPFWYSTPVLTPIIAFFLNIGKKKEPKKAAPEKPGINSTKKEKKEGRAGKGESTMDLVKAAREIEAAIVPEGRSLDDYLEAMEGRWGSILDGQAREDLVTDVNSFVQDRLRRNIQLRKNVKLTRESLTEVAEGLIASTTALNSLRDRDSLKRYMELYMVKLLLTVKF